MTVEEPKEVQLLKFPNIMGLSYVHESPYIMGLSYVLSIMGLSYVQRFPMGLSYV